MVFNGVTAFSVAHLSANLCQRLACVPLSDRVSSSQLLDLVCCFPLQQLGRLALCIWTFLCVPPPDSYYSYTYSYGDSDDDDDDDDGGHDDSSSTVDLEDYYNDSHSD